MRIRRWLGVVMGAAMLATCGRDNAEMRLDGSAQAGVMPVDAATLAELAEEYPRLKQQPLPQPQPSAEGAAEAPDLPHGILETVRGEATFYAARFEGRRTASGIPFRQNQMVAAHRAYPFGTILRVTNMRNERSVNVRVVDRGPFGNSAHARRTIIDLSRRAADRLGYVAQGRTPVKVEVLEWGRGISG